MVKRDRALDFQLELLATTSKLPPIHLAVGQPEADAPMLCEIRRGPRSTIPFEVGGRGDRKEATFTSKRDGYHIHECPLRDQVEVDVGIALQKSRDDPGHQKMAGFLGGIDA